MSTVLLNKETSQNTDLKAMIKFLKITKEGGYSEIEQSSLDYSRSNYVPETIDTEESFFYSLS